MWVVDGSEIGDAVVLSTPDLRSARMGFTFLATAEELQTIPWPLIEDRNSHRTTSTEIVSGSRGSFGLVATNMLQWRNHWPVQMVRSFVIRQESAQISIYSRQAKRGITRDAGAMHQNPTRYERQTSHISYASLLGTLGTLRHLILVFPLRSRSWIS